MSVVAQFAEAWLKWTVAASWQLALLVCLIAALAYLLRDSSPRLRYGLWLLVLLKALLPPTLAAFWGIGTWGVAPVVDAGWATGRTESSFVAGADRASPASGSDSSVDVVAETGAAAAGFTAHGPLLAVWAAGCGLLWGVVGWRYRRLGLMARSMRRIDEGPARVELERLAGSFSVRTLPELYATEQATSPMLVGVIRPMIVLPESILARLGPDELRMILAHELVHWRRYDTWVGWLQVFVQGVFWFHPLVWLANARIRHERECACDETVLREARCDRDGYGETIIRVLTAARGQSLVTGNMAGIFERGSLLQTRLEEIMSFDPTKRRFGWLARAALVAVALVLLPMAAPSAEAERAEQAQAANGTDAAPNGADDEASSRPKTNWPTIVSTTPEIGATDVDPSLPEIRVTFDRDMDVTGYSWTGGEPLFPPREPDKNPVWIDKRTCVLPVQLKRASYYRVGINSTSHQNFRSTAGVPAPTTAIYFATAGASRTMANRVRVPKIVELSPENGATDVSTVSTFWQSLSLPGSTWSTFLPWLKKCEPW